MARRLSVLAGSGGLVSHVVSAARAAGDEVQVLAFAPQQGLPDLPVLAASLADPQGILRALLAFRTSHVVMAGAVTLSDRTRENLAGFVTGGASGAAVGDAALAGLAQAIRTMAGAELIGVHEVAADLLAPPGRIAGPEADETAMAAARLALSAARTIGRLDLGQAVVVAGARVVAAEDVAGTDELLARIGRYRQSGLIGDGAGPLVLAKASKPQQPLYVDLPAIGPATIENAAAAGIGLVAVEAGRSLLIDRAGILATAVARGVTVLGLPADG